MTERRSPWLACLAILLAGLLARATAQTVVDSDALEEKRTRSHLIDANRFGLPAGTAEEVFLQRLKSIHGKEISEVLRNNLQREQLDQLMQNRETVRNFLDNFQIKNLGLSDELRMKIGGREAELEKYIRDMKDEEFLKYAQQAQGLHPPPDAGGQQPGSTPATPSTPSTGEPSASSRPPAGESRTPDPAVSDTDAANPQAKSVLGRWLLQAAHHFNDLDPSVRNSPALRKIVRELSQRIEGADERWKELDQGATAIADKWARLGQALPLDRFWPEKGFSLPRGLTAESLPNMRLPELGSPFGRSPSVPRPRLGISDLTESSAWSALWILVALAAVGLIYWRALKHSQAGGLGERPEDWKLGPWPIHPSAVRTREELIRAFEYLSVLRLGPAARYWHHLAIGSGLGRSSGAVAARVQGDALPEQRRAAEELVSLYERARYAPPAEPLPEAILATARRDLCLLAGVPLS